MRSKSWHRAAGGEISSAGGVDEYCFWTDFEILKDDCVFSPLVDKLLIQKLQLHKLLVPYTISQQTFRPYFFQCVNIPDYMWVEQMLHYFQGR